MRKSQRRRRLKKKRDRERARDLVRRAREDPTFFVRNVLIPKAPEFLIFQIGDQSAARTVFKSRAVGCSDSQ